MAAPQPSTLRERESSGFRPNRQRATTVAHACAHRLGRGPRQAGAFDRSPRVVLVRLQRPRRRLDSAPRRPAGPCLQRAGQRAILGIRAPEGPEEPQQRQRELRVVDDSNTASVSSLRLSRLSEIKP